MNQTEREIITAIDTELQANGYGIYSINDGGDLDDKVSSITEAIEIAEGVDDCTIFWEEPGTKRLRWVYFIFNNGDDGRTVVCDHVDVEPFSSAINKALQPWEDEK